MAIDIDKEVSFSLVESNDFKIKTDSNNSPSDIYTGAATVDVTAKFGGG